MVSKFEANLRYCLRLRSIIRPEKQQRETLASLGIMGDNLRAPWNPSDHHSPIVLRGLTKATLNRAPIIPRDASLLDSQCNFFEAGRITAPNFLARILGGSGEKRKPDVIWMRCHTQGNIFQIWLNQPKIRLYLPFSDWFGNPKLISFGSKLTAKW